MLLKKLPYPAAGLMLALASLGNLLMSYGTEYRYALGVLSAIILLALVAKTAMYPKDFTAALAQMPVASVMPTFSMGLGLLAGYIRPHAPLVSQVLWWVGLSIHLALLVSFTIKHVWPFSLKKVLPGWFIVYVGLAAFSITAPAFGQRPLGQAILIFALAAYVALLWPVLNRVLVTKDLPPPLLPTIAILMAPSSMTLVGYINSFQQHNLTLIYLLLVLTVISVVGVAVTLPKLLALPFAPSVAALAFPSVIAAIAFKTANGLLNRLGQGIPLLSSAIVVFEIAAAVMVAVVLYRYCMFLASPTPAATSKK